MTSIAEDQKAKYGFVLFSPNDKAYEATELFVKYPFGEMRQDERPQQRIYTAPPVPRVETAQKAVASDQQKKPRTSNFRALLEKEKKRLEEK